MRLCSTAAQCWHVARSMWRDQQYLTARFSLRFPTPGMAIIIRRQGSIERPLPFSEKQPVCDQARNNGAKIAAIGADS